MSALWMRPLSALLLSACLVLTGPSAAARALHAAPVAATARHWAVARAPQAAPLQATASGEAPGAPSARWGWPLTPRPRVARPFVRPTSTWAAGHRGLDLTTTPGAPVLAVADGTVSHVGVIADRGTVSVVHASGVRSTYEPVEAVVAVGQHVQRGDVIGQVSPTAGHCAPATCLHLGAVRERTYLNPMWFLAPVRVVLLTPVPD